MTAAPDTTTRYQHTTYRNVGRAGLQLPPLSLGAWHNFGAAGSASHEIADEDAFHARARELIVTAFDLGITHIDLANNYGPPPGAAEARMGRILKELPRDELVISSKAGYDMWPGPYGKGGSRKHLIASCDQSLARLGLDYVDIFYHHRPDPQTPIEETMAALDQLVRAGKALYVGVSNYSADQLISALRICDTHRLTPPIIHQPRYSMLNRTIEQDLLGVAAREGVGLICFSPLAQGLLTNKYLGGVPADSRAALGAFLKREAVTPDLLVKLRRLNGIAADAGLTLAQMAIAWVLRHEAVTSALIGASRREQIAELVRGATVGPLAPDLLMRIEDALASRE